jgi:hypothetical protein
MPADHSVGPKTGAWVADLRVLLLRWRPGSQHPGLVTIRMLYLIFVRLTGWMALLGRADIVILAS